MKVGHLIKKYEFFCLMALFVAMYVPPVSSAIEGLNIWIDHTDLASLFFFIAILRLAKQWPSIKAAKDAEKAAKDADLT